MKIKYFYIVLLLVILSISNLNGQFQRCSTKELEDRIITNDPSYITRRNLNESNLQAFIHSPLFSSYVNSRSSIIGPIIQVPVVIHLIGNDIISDISFAKVQEQIQILNNDYRKISGTLGDGNGVDTQIEFQLACEDPFGNPTDGIDEVEGTFPTYDNTDADNASLKSLSYWPNTQYLNIWVCKVTAGLLAWGTFPSMYLGTPNEYQDGVVIGVNYFGNTTDPNYGNGRTLTHEVGHWLDLYHTWGDVADCTGTDFCDDTPICSDKYFSSFATGCIHPNQCTDENTAVGSTDVRQIENYMDYSDDLCMNIFTQDQKNRMHATIYNYRNSLSLISLCPTCNDGIKNQGETGIDCGGPNCPPCASGGSVDNSCPTIYFTINGNPTTDIVNICQPNIILAPYNPAGCSGLARWRFRVEQITGLCSGISTWQNAQRVYEGWFLNYCYVQWFSLFISIQECDGDKNLIGSESSMWFNIYDNDISSMEEAITFRSFNVNDHLPPGFYFQGGKYYKIKIASYDNGDVFTGNWIEHNGYVKIYTDNLLIQNNGNVDHDQFANNIIFEDSFVPTGTNIKVDAKTLIDLLPNSDFLSGHYYIEDFDCTDLDQFHAPISNNNSGGSQNPNSNSSYINTTQMTNEQKAAPTKNKTESTTINIYPNPATNEINIDFETNKKQNVSVNLFTINSTLVKSLVNNNSFEKGLNTIKINTTDVSNGVYYIQMSLTDETITKKIIILKD
jgi:hypothetical protein